MYPKYLAKQKNYQQHPFHLVDPRPWPLVASISAITILSGAVMWFHGYNGGGFTLIFGIFGVVCIIYTWWRDIIREATFEGQHTSIVQLRMRMGIILFITSEVIFFFAFFWAFFHIGVFRKLIGELYFAHYYLFFIRKCIRQI